MLQAQKTLKIWQEQYLWRQAEERGEDLTLLAQQWRDEEIQGIAACRLSNSDIVEIMDDHCIAIAKRHIKRCTQVINEWRNEVRVAKSMDPQPWGWWHLALVAHHAPIAELALRKGLRSILGATLVKQGKKEVGYDSIGPTEVENARAVGIERLYDFTGGKRFGQRFRANCPFHGESTPSFFIFKDNKFRCFGCGEHGDAIDFTIKMMGLDFIEAVKYLQGK